MEGLAIGTTRFSIAALSAIGIGAAFLILRFLSFGVRNRYDAVLSLRIVGDVPATTQVLNGILRRHATRLNLASERRSTAEGTDLSYRLLLRALARSRELHSALAR